jgi:hypothetical protein
MGDTGAVELGGVSKNLLFLKKKKQKDFPLITHSTR